MAARRICDSIYNSWDRRLSGNNPLYSLLGLSGGRASSLLYAACWRRICGCFPCREKLPIVSPQGPTDRHTEVQRLFRRGNISWNSGITVDQRRCTYSWNRVIGKGKGGYGRVVPVINSRDAPNLADDVVTASFQRVDNKMTFLLHHVVWPLCLTHSTAGTKS